MISKLELSLLIWNLGLLTKRSLVAILKTFLMRGKPSLIKWDQELVIIGRKDTWSMDPSTKTISRRKLGNKLKSVTVFKGFSFFTL